MSYYSRPQGDYKTYGYAGDPGFLSSLWKGIKKVAPSIIGGLIGGPVGAVAGSLGGGGGGGKQMTVPGTFGGSVAFPGGVSVSGGYVPGTIVPGQGRLPPFTATGAGVLPFGGRGGGACATCPTGYHFDKRTGTKCVRNRRMNVANPRALRRSLRRIQGFEKLVKRTFSVSGTVRVKKARG